MPSVYAWWYFCRINPMEEEKNKLIVAVNLETAIMEKAEPDLFPAPLFL